MNCPHQNPASPDTCDRCERPEIARIRVGFEYLALNPDADVDEDDFYIPMREALDVVRSVLADQPTVTYRPVIETR